ncbi:MAG TPA: VWA domain-containing protein [Solirubrobacteraceae bacterium]|nr:VWA domain-containing protein [Solirubrobacteraceae bacterium]
MRRCRLAVGALGVLAVLLAPAGARAQSQPAPDKDAAVILVVDASKSMKADDGSGRPKMAAAKAALNTLVDELPDDAKVGLRIYGSQVSGTGKAEGCADTKLVSPVAPLDRAGLKASINAITPRGFTPIGASLQAAAKDLGTAKQKTVVLVSDGGDNCAPPAPCGVARELAQGGVALKIQAVGFQVKSGARRQLQCIADAGGGRYVDADNAQELGGQLRSLTARALRAYVTQGKALEGVPAPAQAKLYGAGQYVTQVGAGAPTWFSFKVGAGQSISVSATLPDSEAGIPAILKTELQDESLEYMDSDAASNSDDVVTAIVKDAVEERDLRDPPAGRLFYMLDPDPAPGQSGPYPVELSVRVTGKALAPDPTPEDSEDPPSSGGGGAGSSADDGTSDLVLAAGGAGGILVGVLAGGAAAGMALGRRRPA